MLFCFFDTEGTGLTSNDEVIQFSSIICDTNFNIVGYIDKYCYTTFPSHPDAYKVHKIDYKLLVEKSNYQTLEDIILNPSFSLAQQKEICYIAYNARYDITSIKQTLDKYGAPTYNFGKKVPGLRYAKGVCHYDISPACKEFFNVDYNVPLVNVAVKALGLLEDIQAMFHSRFSEYEDISAHNALFDSYLCYLIVKKYKQRFV